MNLSELNNEQKKAVLHTEGPLLIFAGAGCGKTKTLTYRIAYLIEEANVKPENILAVSFTNKAAREMKLRVEKIIKNKNISKLTISTFHSFCVRILRKEINLIGFKKNFLIYSTADQISLIKQIITDNFLEDELKNPMDVLNIVSCLKSNLIFPEDYNENHIIKIIYENYQLNLKSYNALDFDDLILLTIKLFDEHPETLKKYQEKFKYILIDEYQDTNIIQFELLKYIAPPEYNICAVGDDDQSIYRWRGADVSKILNFEKDFKKTKIIKLEQNYRSKNNILKLANSVIKNNINRKDKNLWSELGEGAEIIYYRAKDGFDEAEFVVNKIKELIKLNKYKYKDISILYRANHQSKDFELALNTENIPYIVVGSNTYYDKKEIKDITAYLKIIYNMYDEINLLRIINYPRRGIGTGTIIKINEFSIKNKISIIKVLEKIDTLDIVSVESQKRILYFLDLITDLKNYFKSNSLFDSLNYLIQKISIEDEIYKDNTDAFKAAKKMDNVREFIQYAQHLENSPNWTEPNKKLTLQDFLETISLTDEIDDKPDEFTENKLTLMTLHSAKGLEFKVIFLVGLEDDILPHKKTMLENFSIDEERRLFYVGITRARDLLFLTNSIMRNKYGKEIPKLESRFLKEIPEDYLKHIDSQTDLDETTDDGSVENLLTNLKNKLNPGHSPASPLHSLNSKE